VTLRERYIKGLQVAGYKPIETRSRKYLGFEGWTVQGRHITLWLGKAGAVRQGRTVSKSLDTSSQLKTSILRLAEQGGRS